MKTIKNFKYEAMGCFKSPITNFTILGEYEEVNKRYHLCDYDMNLMVGKYSDLLKIYDKLVSFLTNVEDELGFEPDVMFCGLFENGDKSLLFASDGTYEFENDLLNCVGVPRGTYIKEAHCNRNRLQENHPSVVNDIDEFFNELW